MIKFFKVLGWGLYLILLFISGILIGGFFIPYLVIRRYKTNKMKKSQTNSLDRIANSLEKQNGKWN